MSLLRQMSETKRYFKHLKYLFLCLCFLVSLYSQSSAAFCQLKEINERTRVKKVIDGDTIIINDGRKVRLIGINTPEIGRDGEASEPFAVQALQKLNNLLGTDTEIGLSYDRQKKDKYKRLLAHIAFPDGRNAASELLNLGLAVSIVVPPNDSYLECYRKVEQQARSKQRGLWMLPENSIIAAEKLSSRAQGYRFVRGTIKRYKTSKKSIYLELGKTLSIRISKRDLKQFKGLNLKSLKDSRVEVRGWINTYQGRQSIHLRHTDNIRVLTKL